MNRVASPGKPQPSAIYALILNNNATCNCVWLSGRRCGAKNGDPGRFGVMAVRQAIDLACFPGAGKPVRSIGVRPLCFAASSWPRTRRTSSPGCKATPFHPSPLERALQAACEAKSAFRGLSGFSDTNNQLCLFFGARPNEASGEEAGLQSGDSNLYRKLAKGDIRCH